MKKAVGYAFSIVGLAILVVNSGMIDINSEILDSLNPYYVLGAGLVFVALGVVVVLISKESGRRKNKQAEEEVPIYEGTGKKRRIVGYRKE